MHVSNLIEIFEYASLPYYIVLFVRKVKEKANFLEKKKKLDQP